MDILYLLIPLSAVLVLAIVAIFGWAVQQGQFEDLDGEAERILTDGDPALDSDQAGEPGRARESRVESNASE